MDIASSIIKLQSAKHWSISHKEQPVFELSQEVMDRYKNFPSDWIEFVTSYQGVTNSNETSWFLCSNDYMIQDKDAFRWNEWEQLSLQAAADENDTLWRDSIQKFWDEHLPIMLSVADGYEYYAIRISDGVIVNGCEPEFEDCYEIANSFTHLLEKIINDEIVLG